MTPQKGKIMPKDKMAQVKVHVNRMGKDGAHLVIRARDKDVGSFTCDIKYDDLPDEEMVDALVAIGEKFKNEAESIVFETAADLRNYGMKCMEGLTQVLTLFGDKAGMQ